MHPLLPMLTVTALERVFNYRRLVWQTWIFINFYPFWTFLQKHSLSWARVVIRRSSASSIRCAVPSAVVAGLHELARHHRRRITHSDSLGSFCMSSGTVAHECMMLLCLSYGGLVLVSYRMRIPLASVSRTNILKLLLVFLSVIFFALCVKYVRISCNVNLY